MSLYIRSLTSEEEIELNNTARNVTDIKFAEGLKSFWLQMPGHQLNKLLKFGIFPSSS
ncbi:MAG: hypothetical protein PHW73_07930 [Atribacterota bacterium]|nr:hypothetical protein [Atribacterota bacterium]